MKLFIAVGKVLDMRTLCPGFPIKTLPWTMRMHLLALQKQSTQRKIMKKQVIENDQTVRARTRKRHHSPSKKGTCCQNCKNGISIREMLMKTEVNKVLTSCRVCQTDNSKKFALVKVSEKLFDSTGSLAHSNSLDSKLAAVIAKRVREPFSTTYPEFGSKASKPKFYAQPFSPNSFIYHLIVKSSIWNKPTYSSLRAALEAMLQHAQKYKIQKISIPRLATGIDQLIWLKV